MKSFSLKIFTPDNKLFDGQVTKVFLRAERGELAVLSGHMPLITTIKPCECRVDMEDGSNKSIMLSGGILSVFKDGTTIVTYDI